jgi:hypothetical protein
MIGNHSNSSNFQTNQPGIIKLYPTLHENHPFTNIQKPPIYSNLTSSHGPIGSSHYLLNQKQISLT